MPQSNYCQVWYCWRQKSKWSDKWCNIHRCQAIVGSITGRSCGHKKADNSLYCINHQYYNK